MAINSGPVGGSPVGGFGGGSSVVVTPPGGAGDILTITLEHKTPSFSGILTANIEHKLSSHGVISAGISHTLYESPTGNAQTTAATIFIDGVDMSTKITGTISVTMKEGTARIADFDILPNAGIIDPYDWIGKQVTIDYNTIRVFTGLVHVPTFNHTTAIVSFKCSDALQETVEQLTKEQVDDIVGGYWDESVFVKFREGWSYSQQRLSTIPVEYDLDVFRAQRITPWLPKNTADFSYDSTNVVYNSSRSRLAERRSIINKIELEFNVNYNKPHQRDTSKNWIMPTTFDGWLARPYDLPTKQQILGSLNGRTITSIAFGSLPLHSGIYNTTVGPVGYIANQHTRGRATSASWTDSMRWLQNVKKKHKITLNAPASISKHGELMVKRSTSVSFDNNEDWEYSGASINTNPLGVVNTVAPVQGNLINYQNALETILNRSKTEILASHRQNSVTFETPLNPLLDVDLTCSIDIARVNSTGKVSELIHNFNTLTGRATSTVTISCYKPSEAGQINTPLNSIDKSTVEPVIATPSNNLPTGSYAGITTHIGGAGNSIPEQPDWLGWITNYSGGEILPVNIYYSKTWRVTFDGVKNEDRQNKDWSQENVIDVAIPQNNLTLIS